MTHSVKVTIKREQDKVIVINDKGAYWVIPCDNPPHDDNSVTGIISSLSAAFLCGTINSHLHELNSPEITYTLTIDK
jgi:hypothetical protein